MTPSDDAAVLAAAIDLAQQAAAIARDYAGRLETLTIDEKGPLDLVTEADRAIEAFLRDAIAKRYPEDGFFGEESDASATMRARTWVVDPIDGTANFLRGSPRWAISIGVYEAGHARAGVIHAPMCDRLIAGAVGQGATLNGKRLPRLAPARPRNGVCAIEVAFSVPAEELGAVMRFARGDCGLALRCNGATTMALMQVALGHADMHAGIESASWDFLAGMAIVEALGGAVYTNRPLGDLRGPYRVFCGRPGLAAAWEPVIRR